jgi:uncharacterized membrane protein required for colicin V production
MHINIADCIITAVLILSAVSGFRKGFFASLGKIASAVLAIGTAFYYGNEFMLYPDNKFHIIDILAEHFCQKIPILVMSRESALLSFIMPPESLTELTKQLARFLIEPTAYIVLFFFAYIVFQLLFMFLNRLVSGQFLGGINRILGMILLAIQSVVVIMIVLGMAMPPLEFAARLDIIGAAKLYSCLQDSYLVNYLLEIFGNLKTITGRYA